jgi:hypothetical protein
MTEEMKEKVQVRKKNKHKISRENAEAIIEKIFDYYELELDDFEDDEPKKKDTDVGIEIETETEEDDFAKATKMTYKRLVRFAMKGRIETNERDGEFKIIQHFRKPLKDGRQSVTWGEPTAYAKVQMKKASEKDAHGRMLYFMAALCKEFDANTLGNLRGPDMSLMECISAVFFMV